jgi:high affinity Mn2+ porin
MSSISLILALMMCSFIQVYAASDSTQTPWFDAHFQLTSITQINSAFSAPYSGTNSLGPASQSAMSLTATLFLKAQLWKGAELVFHPEIAGGEGLSGATGMAGFPNGENLPRRAGKACLVPSTTIPAPTL